MGTTDGPSPTPTNHPAVEDDYDSTNKSPTLDAGAQFVLKSRGSWIHCGYHLTTSIVAPPLLSLPFAFASLGWTAGILSLLIGALVTFYSYNLLSLVLEHHAHLGRRHLRFRDVAYDILGPRWGMYYVGPIQFLVCYGAVVACILLGGQCLKTVYVLSSSDGDMKLFEFVIIFGGLMLILAQVPSFHSLRHINLVSLVLCLVYSTCATAGSIYIGRSSKGPRKNYSLSNEKETRLFGVFNALAIIATTFGNGIIPEIQATLAPPVKGKMFKGLCVCYSVVAATFFSVAISGYWAFGNQAKGLVLSNFFDELGKPLVPKWFILMTNVFTILQLSAVGVVYLQPTNEVLERAFADPQSKEFSPRNVVPRVISRSISVVIATTIAAMLPFFGDINALIGAFGFMPLDFVLPFVFFNLTFKAFKRNPVFWLNITIAVFFSALGLVATVAAVRQIILDAKSYRLFANV
ncbi:Transmembrane amino acid transporter family protein isoform 1 [Dorcoceras hygrometricum]|uniref:Transmembrane amino acid transporter family protein isoform 1 n=1 Tax=Dorcoceras hygrometricum TaxID=472368 RepID=A0A2Z7C7X6_9LAMI|nr:Transmembrane amino acid transporter family protein isoform 1 [Dorcoceras hygrometricum]